MSNSYFIYGHHPVSAALNNSEREFIEIFVTPENLDRYEEQLKARKIVAKIKNKKQISHLLVNSQNYLMINHQGIVARVKTSDIWELDEKLLNSMSKIVILDHINDPNNIGSIIRSAATFGIDGVVMTKDNSSYDYGCIAKVASGGLEWIKLIRTININRCIDFLKEHDFWIVGLASEGSHDIKYLDKYHKIAMIFGAEGKGIRPLVRKNCDLLARINTGKNFSELNVNNAASIAFFTIADID